MSNFDLDRYRRLAVSSTDTGKLARALESACDEIARLRQELVKTANYAESSARIARKALT